MSTIVTFQIMLFPTDQETRVRPAGCLPSERKRPVSFMADGILARDENGKVA